MHEMPYTKNLRPLGHPFKRDWEREGVGEGKEESIGCRPNPGGIEKRPLGLSHWIRWDSAKQAVNHVFCSVILCLNSNLFLAQVVRSRLQEQGHARNAATHYAGEQGHARSAATHYAGALDCTKKVFQKDGIPGFYRGCATNLLRTTPAAVITFTSYEMIQRFLRRAFPPEQNHSGAGREPVSHAKPQPVSVSTGEKKKDTGAQTQQNQLAKRELTAGS